MTSLLMGLNGKYKNSINGSFTLSDTGNETNTDTDKILQNPVDICIGLSLSSMSTSTNSKQTIFIGPSLSVSGSVNRL